MMRATLVTLVLAAASALAQTPDYAQKCPALVDTVVSRLANQFTVVLATLKAASPATGTPGGRGSVPALPAHCDVRGTINERPGDNGQHYAINFHMRLPSEWNGRFFFEGGGGSNGNVGDALGNLQGQQTTNALTLGYAVVSQDSGHDNATNNDPKLSGTQTFGWDALARLDFGYRSYDLVTREAKDLIRTYYGRSPDRSYYVGCSEGGREAMMMSQRFPDYYDGILACSPGFKLPKAAVAEAWDVQAFATVAKEAGLIDANGEPFLNKTFTDADFTLVANAILAACDKLDGLADGVISNFRACTSTVARPALEALTCKAGKDATCLTASQIAGLEKVYSGAKNSKGESLYSDWAWDAGIGSGGWRVWKIGAFGAPGNSAINATLGSGAVSAIFSTPPVTVASTGAAPVAFMLKFDMDTDAPKIFAKSDPYRESSWDFMMASNTDLSAFKKRGGKLIVTHGVSDPIFSVNDTISWVDEVNKRNKGKASDFVRFFAVPGMTHCGGGPSTDRFDAFNALVAWVEKKTPPESIVATAGPATPWPGRTRPLCPYPTFPHYKGTGSVEEAANFSCR